MLELPPKFKQALGNGVRTSLYPLVKIYQGYRIDDTIPDDAESINLSIKETNVSGSAYKPLLLNAPSIKSSADIINNKYTISSVSLSISNAPFQGQIFSDNIQSLLNAVCQVYYCANGIDSIDDCLLVYTGTIRRFNQSAETIKLELEDLTQQMLSTKIPSSTVPDEIYYKEDDIGKPYPMVYGYVDKSPVIPRSLGTDSMGELKEQLTKFHIDKRGKEIEGLWRTPNLEDYGNPNLNLTHPLVDNGYIKEVGTLAIYESNFIPIPQYLDFEQEWYYYLNGITDDEDENYKKITVDVDSIYDLEQSNGVDSSASIKVNAEALINEEEVVGLPTRIYRPIDKVECFTFCDDNPEQAGVGLHSLNRIYGFTNYDIYSAGNWYPWEFSDNVTSSAYDDNYNGQGWNNDWWEPTACNENLDGGYTSAIDINWQNDYGIKGFFPVDRIQDGATDKGIYVCGRNAEGKRPEHNKTGMAAVKFILKNNIASFPCTSKIVYDAECHEFANMDGMANNSKIPYPVSFWTGEQIPVSDGAFAGNLVTYTNEGTFPDMPNGQDGWGMTNTFQNYQSEGEATARKINGYGEAKTFNNTTAFDNFKFGIEQYDGYQDYGNFEFDNTIGNDTAYAAALLFNVYLLQDAVIDQPLDKQFFADVAGRALPVVYSETTVDISSISVYMHQLQNHYLVSKFTTNGPHNFSLGDTIIIENTEHHNGIFQVIWVDVVNEQGENQFEILAPSDASDEQNVGQCSIFEYKAITSSQNIMQDILEEELNYKEGNIQNIDEIDDWQNSFVLNEQREAKEVLEGLFKSSLIIPSFNAKGQFSFIPLYQILDGIEYNVIDNQDLLKYSFSLTRIDDVKNQINVKYKKNYGSGEFDKETGYGFIDLDNPDDDIDDYDALTRKMYPEDETRWYNIDYYGLTSEEAKLEVETEYIRDEDTARKLQKRLLCWYANQHLIVKLELPVSYMNLEVGDYIHFNELIGGKLAFGYDYIGHYIRNGQVIYPIFFINKISKSLDKINIEAVQVHRGEYGVPETDIIIDEDENIVTDEGGNDGQGNFDYGDPSDNPDYDNNTIVEEEIEGIIGPDPYFITDWSNMDSDLNNAPQAMVSSHLIGEFQYEVYITSNDTPFEYDEGGTGGMVLPVVEEGQELDASNYIESSVSFYTNNEGNIQGGHILLWTPYLIPEGHNGITGILRIFYEGTEYTSDLTFTQYYVEPSEDVGGDWNGDGILNVLDVVGINQIIIANEGGNTGNWNDENSNNYSPQSDINGDGIVNVLDVVTIINLILG
jgi:hypothetical protein